MMRSRFARFAECFRVLGLGLALAALGSPARALTAITSLSAGAAGFSSPALNLSWTEPDVLPAGSSFIIQYATYSGVAFSTSAAQVWLSTSIAGAGAAVSVPLYTLNPNTNYYVSVWTTNGLGTYSGVSNTANALTTAKLPAAPAFSIGQNETLVLGQANFTSNGPATSAAAMSGPLSAAFDGQGNLWVVDSANGRVLQFTVPLSSGMAAAVELGQTNFTSFLPATAANHMANVGFVAFDAAGSLWVSDTNRVLRFDPPFSTAMSASLVLGQADFVTSSPGISQSTMSAPFGLAFDPTGSLWVADAGNNRVLQFRPPFSNAMNASLVIGQADFVSSGPPTAAQNSFGGLAGISVDASGNLWVVDGANNRVLEFSPPFSNAMNASLVIGQAGFTFNAPALAQNGLSGPQGNWIAGDGGLWVADTGANRVLKFAPPLSSGMNASLVLGQTVYTSSTSITTLSRSGLANPMGEAESADGSLWVADNTNNRVVSFAPAGGLSGVSSGSVTASWSANGNPSGTQYYVEASTQAAFAAPLYKTSGGAFAAATTQTVVGLLGSTTFYFHAQARNSANVTTSFVVLGSTFTPPAPPGAASAPFSAVSASALGFNWALGSNSGSPQFEADLSTSSTFGVLTSSLTFNMQASFAALSPNTTYFLRVKVSSDSQGQSGPYAAAASTSTLAAAPAGLSSTAVFITSVTLTWMTSPNPAGTAYQLSYSTPGGPTSTVSAGTVAPFTLAGLSAGTAYSFLVSAVNNNGVVTPGASTTTITGTNAVPPVAPGAAAAPFTGLSSGALTYNWTIGANTGSPQYEADLSTDAAFAVQTSSLTFNTQASFASLSPNTTYFLRVKVSNGGSGLSGPYAAAASTATLAAAPTGASFGAVYLTSAAVSWTAANPAGTTYRLSYWAAGGSTATLGGLTLSSAAVTGLATGTPYFAQVSAVNWNGVVGVPSPLASTVTVAVPPSSAPGSFAQLVLGEADFNSIGGGTSRTALMRPSGVAVHNGTGQVFVADSANHRVLWWNSGCTLSNDFPAFGVLGQADFVSGLPNRGGAPSAATLSAPTYLAVDPAGRLWVSDTGNHRVLRYSPPFSNGMTADLVIGQAAFAGGLPNAGAALGASGLAAPAGIAFDLGGDLWVADFGNNRVLGYPAPQSSGMSAAVVLGQADFVSGRPNRGAAVSANGLGGPRGVAVDASSGVWVTDAGNNRTLKFPGPVSSGMSAALVLGQASFTAASCGTSASLACGEDSLSFDASGNLWVADSNAAGLPSNHRVLGYAAPFATGMAATALLGQPSWSSNAPGLGASSFDQAGQITVDGSNDIWVADAFNYRVLEFIGTKVSGAVIPLTAKVMTSGPFRLSIPAGAFRRSVVMTLDTSPALPSGGVKGVALSTTAIAISNDQRLEPSQDMTLSMAFTYAGLGGADPKQMTLLTYDAASGRWLPIETSVDLTGLTAHAKISSLSLVRAGILAAAPSVSEVLVYPNPYRPGSGGRFDNSAVGAGVVFSSLPVKPRIRILDIAGRMVRDVSPSDGSGQYLWDTTNQEGDRVASGVYIYLVTNLDDDSQRSMGRFSIIR